MSVVLILRMTSYSVIRNEAEVDLAGAEASTIVEGLAFQRFCCR